MKVFAAVLLCALGVVACAAPARPPTPVGSPPPVAPPTPAPSASPSFAVACLGSPKPGATSGTPTVLNDCSDLVSAVLAAVARLGYPVQAMTIRTFDFGCGGPFVVGVYSCPMIPAGPTTIPGSAYVTFVGTDKIAAVSFHAVDDPPLIAKLVAFEVPPAGWVMP